MRAPSDMDAFIQRDLVAVIEAARGRVVMRGWSRFRHPVVELDGEIWLDFIGACRSRSAWRH